MIVHPPPRDLETRRRDRAAGVDLNGLPTARSLGIAPRDLVKAHGLTMNQAYIASRELLARAHRELLEQRRRQELEHPE